MTLDFSGGDSPCGNPVVEFISENPLDSGIAAIHALSLTGLLRRDYPSETPLPQIITGLQGSGSRLNVSEQ